MPVRIDKLGAHLEAYIKTQPTVIALRLCGRFGSGPHCHINKLPVELIGAIETFIVEPARVEALETWSTEYRCFEVKCDLIDDHFTHEEQRAMYLRATCDECSEDDDCTCGYSTDAETAEKLRETLLPYVNHSDYWVSSHDTKCHNWTAKVDTHLPTCIFNEHQAFVRSHFGIDVWTSNVRLPRQRSTLEADKWKLDESSNTTVAYMTLPNNASSCEDWLSGMYDDVKLQSGYAMPLKLGAAPTRASLRRFQRALNLLGLEVFIHPTQKGTVISAPPGAQSSDSADAVDGSAADWPQLTLLTRCCVEEL